MRHDVNVLCSTCWSSRIWWFDAQPITLDKTSCTETGSMCDDGHCFLKSTSQKCNSWWLGSEDWLSLRIRASCNNFLIIWVHFYLHRTLLIFFVTLASILQRALREKQIASCDLLCICVGNVRFIAACDRGIGVMLCDWDGFSSEQAGGIYVRFQTCSGFEFGLLLDLSSINSLARTGLRHHFWFLFVPMTLGQFPFHMQVFQFDSAALKRIKAITAELDVKFLVGRVQRIVGQPGCTSTTTHGMAPSWRRCFPRVGRTCKFWRSFTCAFDNAIPRL